ncbi:hypothetical protein PBT90_16695 [Algoriphagus halophytocola]|uniref:hypothetical protein n=1 Tax=Algoriphagus halophytocola TaxID=2991499 RepID=UPI0022DDD79B|nr:hypothetical protein [Algoriphagus sp. TR-M9]WBL42376.1 hypothetical protein PBT90_16695 [Algoriphagus sp. TR-M9]
MSDKKKETAKLSPAIEGKFEAVGVLPGVIYTKKYGNVDLRTISLEMAEKLAADDKFRYLRKITKESKAAPPAETKK